MHVSKSKLFSLLLLMVFFTMPTVYAQENMSGLGLTYQAHVQDVGWQPAVGENQTAGTVGEGKNLEAFEINLPEGVDGIAYSAHVSGTGWQEPVSAGQVAGTVGQGRAVEAVKIELTGSAAEQYDIYYRVHCANLGWLGWTKNGAEAGTSGLALPVQAIEIICVSKDAAFSQDTAAAYIDGSAANAVNYTAHVQNVGWQDSVANGQISGTIGQGLQLEALKISAPNFNVFGDASSIKYCTHVQNMGWMNWTGADCISGTTGENRRVEAVKIELTGNAAVVYDVYYRVHSAQYGWLDWAKDGAPAGTEQLGKQAEAIEIRIVPKCQPAPGPTERPYINREMLVQNAALSYQVAVENIGWQPWVNSGAVAGTEGKSLGIEALKLYGPNFKDGSGIQYNLHIEDIGWQGYRKNGEEAGTTGQNKQAETIAVQLTGEAAASYDVYYQAQCEDYGWLGWAKNGEWAGTSGGNRKLEALKICLVVKGDPAPGSTQNAYLKAEPKKTGLDAGSIPNFDLICAIVQHEGGASYESALAVMSCVMNRCDSGRWGGTDPVSVLTAPGQFSSYLDGYYVQFLGRSSAEVQRAVIDCMNGKRSHPYQSFRAYPTFGSVNIGGNWYF